MLDALQVCQRKTEKLRPFLQNYWKQSGTLLHFSTLYVPHIFERHYLALAEMFKSQSVSIMADETTNVRDHRVLASVQGKP